MIIEYPGYEIERFESEGGCNSAVGPNPGAKDGKRDAAVPKESRVARKEKAAKIQ